MTYTVLHARDFPEPLGSHLNDFYQQIKVEKLNRPSFIVLLSNEPVLSSIQVALSQLRIMIVFYDTLWIYQPSLLSQSRISFLY